MNSHFFSLYRDYSNSLTRLNASALFLSWISINHIQVHKEKENFVTHCFFTSFTKRETRHFHVVVLQWRQRNVQQNVMHVQNCCFALSSYCCFWFLVAAASQTSYYLRYIVIPQKQNFLSANWIAPADSIQNVFRLIGSFFVWLGKLGERNGQLWRELE